MAKSALQGRSQADRAFRQLAKDIEQIVPKAIDAELKAMAREVEKAVRAECPPGKLDAVTVEKASPRGKGTWGGVVVSPNRARVLGIGRAIAYPRTFVLRVARRIGEKIAQRTAKRIAAEIDRATKG